MEHIICTYCLLTIRLRHCQLNIVESHSNTDSTDKLVKEHCLLRAYHLNHPQVKTSLGPSSQKGKYSINIVITYLKVKKKVHL